MLSNILGENCVDISCNLDKTNEIGTSNSIAINVTSIANPNDRRSKLFCKRINPKKEIIKPATKTSLMNG